MIGVDDHKCEVARSIAKYLAYDEELLRTFRNFDASKFSFDPSPQSFYCSWVLSIMGTAFYDSWNNLRTRVARMHQLHQSEDWATISVLAHKIVNEKQKARV